jgi:hypothetical protein
MPWTPDEDAQLQALAVSGKSAAAIAAKLKTDGNFRAQPSEQAQGIAGNAGKQRGNDQASFH